MENDRIVAVYVKIRDKRSELKRAWEKEDKELKAKLERIEGVLLKTLMNSKTESMRTTHGTFYKELDLTPIGADWDAFYQWVSTYDTFDFLERRIKKTSVAKYMEENKGAVPPGVSVLRKWVVNVRRATT